MGRGVDMAEKASTPAVVAAPRIDDVDEGDHDNTAVAAVRATRRCDHLTVHRLRNMMYTLLKPKKHRDNVKRSGEKYDLSIIYTTKAQQHQRCNSLRDLMGVVIF
jgi:peptide methionine sulfoxide reductase MsrA